MKCHADKLEVDLMEDHSIRVTIRCGSAYEAAILYEDMTEAAGKGKLTLDFDVKNRRTVYDRTAK